MKMSRSTSGSEVIDVRGTMTYEWQDACDGWTTTQESQMKFFYQDGKTVDLGWKLNSWESKDGLRYRFFVSNTTNGKPASEYKGDAKLDGTDKGGSAQFTSPKSETIKLPTGTLFPTAHTITLLNHLKDGDRLLYATVFDGTDDGGPFDISAVLAATPEPEPALAALSPLLAKGPVYRVGLAFFAAGGNQSTPEHEQTLSVYANGIVSRISLNYGSFSVDGVLTKVEGLPAGGC
jgi:EipB-like